MFDRCVPGGQAQRVGGDIELALEVPGAGRVYLFLQFGLLCEQVVHLVIRHGLGKLHVNLVELLE
jgi:hypothetical protein